APLIQSDHPRIRAHARAIVGREGDPARAGELLLRWVADHVDKTVAVRLPSAVQVLARRRGDCNEHTVLYVALARAAGLPARPVAGLLLVDGRFYYHAWAEIYLGDWVAVDPTFGQLPADAARSEEHRLNSSHVAISYAVFCLKKKNKPIGSLNGVE